jgi:methylenetetrahydrofolate dehydrogenase (NADP+)/methenyltetrahydrofolate cyclohydrolase
MKLLDGKKVSADWQKSLKKKLQGKRLDAVMIGDDSSSILYLKKKAEMAKKLGVKFELHKLSKTTTTTQAITLIKKLNEDKQVDGIIVQLPLPKSIDETKVLETVLPTKDVDGLTDANLMSGRVLPATAKGILHMLANYKISVTEQSVALVGFTRLLNVALAMHFSMRGNEVIVLQKDTKDMSELKHADIIITAVGHPKLIASSHVQSGAVVVDAGIARVGKQVVGDVDFLNVSKKASWLTPVPGGVGPMTVVALFANLLEL